MALKILVGDDDMVNQMVVRGLLNNMGYDDCTVVATGQEVLDKMGEDTFDLILLDIQFPDIDGFEVAKKIREMPEPAGKIKIVFISGHDAAEFRAQLDELVPCDFVTKPVTVDALQAVI